MQNGEANDTVEMFVLQYLATDGRWLVAHTLDGYPAIVFSHDAAEEKRQELSPQTSSHTLRIRRFTLAAG